MSLNNEIMNFAKVYALMRQANSYGQSKDKTGAFDDPAVAGVIANARADANIFSRIFPPRSTAGSGGASGGSTAGFASPGPNAVKDLLISKGVKPEVAAGAVGSAMGESGRGLNPASYNPDDNGSPSAGIMNWHSDRLDALYKLAGTTDINKIPLDTQISHLNNELDSTENGTLQQLRNASTTADGNNIWTKSFERPANPDQAAANRLPNGQAFWNYLQQPTGVPAPTSVAASPNPAPAASPTTQQVADQQQDQQQDQQPAFFAGGLVDRPPSGGQRPDRVASAIPGVDASLDRGTPPGGGWTAKTAIKQPGYAHGGVVDPYKTDEQETLPTVLGGGPQPPRAIPPSMPGYADGGSVDESDTSDDTSDDDSSASTPASQPVAAQQPTVPEHPSDLLSGLSDTLKGGMKYIQQAFGITQASAQPSAVPGSADMAQGYSDFRSGKGAASAQDVRALGNSVDPDGQLTEGLRTAAGMNAAYKYYVAHGDSEKAGEAAKSILQYSRGLAAQYGDQAAKLLQSGDVRAGADAAVKAYDAIPNGRIASAKVNADNNIDVTETDSKGKPTQQMTMTPQQLLASAIGLKDGSAYWKVLIGSAEKKYDPDDELSERSPEYTNLVDQLAAEEGKGKATTQQAAVPPQAAPQQAPGAPAPQAQAQALPPQPNAQVASAAPGVPTPDTASAQPGAIPAPAPPVTSPGNPQSNPQAAAPQAIPATASITPQQFGYGMTPANDPEPQQPNFIPESKILGIQNDKEQARINAVEAVRKQQYMMQHSEWQQRQAVRNNAAIQQASEAQKIQGQGAIAQRQQAGAELIQQRQIAQEERKAAMEQAQPADVNIGVGADGQPTPARTAIDAAIGFDKLSPSQTAGYPPDVMNAQRDGVAQIMRFNPTMDAPMAASAFKALIGAGQGSFKINPIPNDPQDRVQVQFKNPLMKPIFVQKNDLPVLDTLRGMAAQMQKKTAAAQPAADQGVAGVASSVAGYAKSGAGAAAGWLQNLKAQRGQPLSAGTSFGSQ